MLSVCRWTFWETASIPLAIHDVWTFQVTQIQDRAKTEPCLATLAAEFSTDTAHVKQALKMPRPAPTPIRYVPMYQQGGAIPRYRQIGAEVIRLRETGLTLRAIAKKLGVSMFIHVKSRQVVLSPATRTPNEAWVAEQAEQFLSEARGKRLKVRYVQRDRDTKFAPAFDGRLNRKRVKVIRNQVGSPNTNAYVERFIQTIQHECLDRFLIFGETHLDRLCADFVSHYHEDRPHQSLGNEPILKLKSRDADSKPDTAPPTFGAVRCRTRLGGLLRSYSRKAA